LKRFCLYPFNRAHLSVNGNVYVCCAAWLKKPLGNFFRDSFENIWNSETAIGIRKSILDESFRFCNKNICPRIISGLIEKEAIPERLKHVQEEKKLHLENGPEHLSLNYDYSCNLYCRSCRKQRRVMDHESSEKLIQFQDSLLKSELFKNARRLTVTGTGEPFASRVYMDLFNKIDQQVNPDLKITLRTNGNLLTPGNWGRIKNAHFAIDAISISMDAATEKTYKILRRGGDFKKLLTNLKFLEKLKKKKKLTVELNFVVQKQNFKEMPGFLKLAKKYNCDRVVYTQLMDRGTYSLEEYGDLSVHKPGHPQFEELKKIINKPIFKDPMVSFNNLSHLID
jgi:MoaA/NifB/PqqE/SkfB family radical SAM enzyme